MRLFIAIDLHPRTKKLLARKIEQIKSKVPGKIKWVKKENWHITLKFLGEVKVDQLEQVKRIINGIQQNKFSILFKNIGAFPSLNYPKIFYVGIKKGSNTIIDIHRKLENELELIGFESENRKFTPHLTVARGKNQKDIKEMANILKNFQDPHFINIHMDISEIKLIESKLHAGGPEYIDVFTKNLQ